MVGVPGLRESGGPAGYAGFARAVREFCGTAGFGWGAAPGRRCTPRLQVYRSQCRRREVAPRAEQRGLKVQSGNVVPPSVPETFRRTFFGPLWGLFVRKLARFTSTMVRAGNRVLLILPATLEKHRKPAHLRADARTFEGNTYGSEP